MLIHEFIGMKVWGIARGVQNNYKACDLFGHSNIMLSKVRNSQLPVSGLSCYISTVSPDYRWQNR